MTNLFLVTPIITLLVGGGLGYLLGKHEANLVKSLKQAQDNKKPVEKPSVLLGAYEPPKEIGNVPDKRPAGLVESKTPERIKWESEQKIDKEALGR